MGGHALSTAWPGGFSGLGPTLDSLLAQGLETRPERQGIFRDPGTAPARAAFTGDRGPPWSGQAGWEGITSARRGMGADATALLAMGTGALRRGPRTLRSACSRRVESAEFGVPVPGGGKVGMRTGLLLVRAGGGLQTKGRTARRSPGLGMPRQEAIPSSGDTWRSAATFLARPATSVFGDRGEAARGIHLAELGYARADIGFPARDPRRRAQRFRTLETELRVGSWHPRLDVGEAVPDSRRDGQVSMRGRRGRSIVTRQKHRDGGAGVPRSGSGLKPRDRREMEAGGKYSAAGARYTDPPWGRAWSARGIARGPSQPVGRLRAPFFFFYFFFFFCCRARSGAGRRQRPDKTRSGLRWREMAPHGATADLDSRSGGPGIDAREGTRDSGVWSGVGAGFGAPTGSPAERCDRERGAPLVLPGRLGRPR